MMKRYLLFLFGIFLGCSLHAQQVKKVKSLILKNGYTINFDDNLQDSVRIILTPRQDTLGLKVYLQHLSSKDYLYSQVRHVEYWGAEAPSDTDTVNINRNNEQDLSRNPEAWRMEFPRLYQGTDVCFEVTHDTKEYGATYSLEWDGTKKANRWTCYQLYSGNMVKNVRRQDEFREDPNIPEAYRTTLSDYSGSGYSRGHLCPSGDRLCSREQNSQTFYLSNMQPQNFDHNSGVWSTLEQRVRDVWAPAQNSEDTLYVVKAATIDDENIQTYTASHLIVPKFFYMALLYYNKTTGAYYALGVWSPHAAGSKTSYISIDELEERTKIDFFCNLPDGLEKQVESKVDKVFWRL